MSSRTVFVGDQGLVHVEGTGRIDGEAAEDLAVRAVAVARENHSVRFLCDFRKAVLVDSAADLYNLPSQAERVGLKRSDRVAIVYSDHEDLLRFVETVGVNRGFNVRLFRSGDAARAWLLDG